MRTRFFSSLWLAAAVLALVLPPGVRVEAKYLKGRSAPVKSKGKKAPRRRVVEWPAETEGQGEPKKPQRWEQDRKKIKAFVRAVKGHVSMQVADRGRFYVRDAKLEKTWELKLVRIHDDRVMRLGGGTLLGCADFKTVGGKKIFLDIDFRARREGEDWFVDEVVVHKVGGVPRFDYSDANKRVKSRKHEPVRAAPEKRPRRSSPRPRK